MTLLEIEILIHYWYSRADYRDLDAPAIKASIRNFVEKGLLIKNEEEKQPPLYRPNREALEPYITAIRSIPMPEMQWVISETEKPYTNRYKWMDRCECPKCGEGIYNHRDKKGNIDEAQCSNLECNWEYQGKRR